MPHSAFRLQDARVGRESGARFAAPYEPVMGAGHATLPPTVWRGVCLRPRRGPAAHGDLGVAGVAATAPSAESEPATS